MLKLLLSLTLATLFITSSSVQNGPKVRRLLADESDTQKSQQEPGKEALREALRVSMVYLPPSDPAVMEERNRLQTEKALQAANKELGLFRKADAAEDFEKRDGEDPADEADSDGAAATMEAMDSDEAAARMEEVD